MVRRAKLTTAEPHGTIKRAYCSLLRAKSAFLRVSPIFPTRPNARPTLLIPNVSAVSEQLPYVKRNRRARRLDNVKTGKTDDRGPPRGTKKGRSRPPQIHLFLSASQDFLNSFPLSSPLPIARSLTFRRFRNAIHL